MFVNLSKNIKVKILEILLFLVGFSIPFSKVFNSICLALLFLFSFLWANKKYYKNFISSSNSIFVLFLLFFLIQFFGVFYSENLNLALDNIKKSSVILILIISFYNIKEIIDYNKVTISILGLILGVFTILISAHTNILSKIFSEDLPMSSLITNFTRVDFVKEAIVEVHPPYLGMLIVFILVPVTKLFLFKKKIFNFICILFILSYLLLSLYEVSSLMSLFLLVVLIFLITILLLIKNKWKTLFSLFLVLTFLSNFFLSFIETKKVSEFGGGSLVNKIDWVFFKEKGDTSRPHNWKSVIKVFKKNIFFGVGNDGGILQLQSNRDKNSESYINKHNAHNQYLEIILRHGIVGSIIYIFLLMTIVVKSIRSNNIIFLWFIIVFLISSLTESYLQRQIGLVFFTFFSILFSINKTITKYTVK